MVEHTSQVQLFEKHVQEQRSAYSNYQSSLFGDDLNPYEFKLQPRHSRFFLTYHVSKRQQIESPHAPFVETPPPPLYELVYNTPTTPLQNGLNDGTYYFLGEAMISYNAVLLELNLSTGDYVVIRKHMMLFQGMCIRNVSREVKLLEFFNRAPHPDIMVATIIGATTGVLWALWCIINDQLILYAIFFNFYEVCEGVSLLMYFYLLIVLLEVSAMLQSQLGGFEVGLD
ncbi:intersectin-1 [Artemisia annua]|uniref:Intersectin-1 n=1 Tax=Artemisia annua TaxID=35608 RepID=A0A2U1QNH4_ARTAN|nr:intersectin-1 [Artemisia annua]